MGPAKTRAQHLFAQTGRFHEGSMRDRASAAPPVHFLGPSERGAIETPIYIDTGGFAVPPLAQIQVDEKEKQLQPRHHHHHGTWKVSSKMSRLGQVWEGVRGKLRLRKDTDDGRDVQSQRHEDARPSREEVFANYHQLVASGFFSSHATHSTTRPGPAAPHTHSTGSHYPPQWPLGPAPNTPEAAARTTVCSPVSAASSRGVKRAAADDEDDKSVDEAPWHGDDTDDMHEDESTLAHRFLPKRLRKAASKDISIPKLRTVTSQRHMRAAVEAAKRSMSSSTTAIAHHEQQQQQQREPNKLTKRMPPQLQRQQQDLDNLSKTRSSIDVPPSASEFGSVRRRIRRPTSARNLRARTAGVERPQEPLSVAPDSNRGIPSVPLIPVKFTYGEDRENDGPWRGLRR